MIGNRLSRSFVSSYIFLRSVKSLGEDIDHIVDASEKRPRTALRAPGGVYFMDN